MANKEYFKWKAFKEELPEIGDWILYGNSHWLDCAPYHPRHPGIDEGRVMYKDVTHWCYVEPIPKVDPLYNFDWRDDRR